MISAIILSAGLSSRFGSSKALAKLNGHTVIEHIQNTISGTAINEIIIVLGASAEEIKPYILKHKKVKAVYNKDYNLGQTSSFKVGLQNICSESQGILLFPIDYPAVKTETINELIVGFTKFLPKIIIPTHEGTKGHPPVFNMSLKNEFLELDNEIGVNTILHRHKDGTVFMPFKDAGIISSFNTQEEFQELKENFLKFDE